MLSVAYAFVVFNTQERYHPDWTVDGKGIRFFQDHFERNSYFIRGSWYVVGMRRVSEINSEYPPLAAYFFGLPFALASIAGEKPSIPETEAFITILPALLIPSYMALIRNLLTALMVPAYLGLFLLTLSLLKERGEGEWRVFVFLLPGFLFFSLNGYDVLPSLMTVAAIAFAWRDKPDWAGILLGMGAMTGWYPALLMPIILGYFFKRERRSALLFVAAFFSTALIASIPVLISGGWRSYIDPFRLQQVRRLEPLSLFGLLAYGLGGRLPQWLLVVMLVCRFVVPLMGMISSQKDRDAMLDWSVLSLLGLVLFAKTYSPQWIIWIMPLLILRKTRPGTTFGLVALLVIWDLLSYALFPVLYDIYGIRDHAPGVVFSVAVLLKTAIMVTLAIDPAKGAWRDFLK
jgi:uncharacterized membrane protein